MGNGCQMPETRVAGCPEIDGQSWSALPPIVTGRADTPALQQSANCGRERLRQGEPTESSDLLYGLVGGSGSSGASWDLEARFASTEMTAETLRATRFFREQRGPQAISPMMVSLNQSTGSSLSGRRLRSSPSRP